MSRTAELQTALNTGIVTVPVAPWEKIHLTGEQYLALTSNAEVLTSSDVVTEALPFPLSIVLLPAFNEVRHRMIDAIFTYDEKEVEAAIRKHCPEVSKDYDAGKSTIDVAKTAARRARSKGAA